VPETVLTRGAPGWADVTQAFNTTVVQQPDLVALPHDAADVADVVRYAAARGLRVGTAADGPQR
jgi:FAD/FMN-containing dehydrogenase